MATILVNGVKREVQAPADTQPRDIVRGEQVRAQFQIRLEDIRQPGPRPIDPAGKWRWSHAHDCYGLFVVANDSPNDVRIGSKAVPPQLLAHDHHRLVGDAVAGL